MKPHRESNDINLSLMIQISDISFRYGLRGQQVFNHFSLRFTPGHIYGLLGKNGTGKSTLLYLVSGLLFPDSGSVSCFDTDVTLRRPEVLQDVFLVPEEFELPNLTMADYVKLNAPFYPRFDAAILSRRFPLHGAEEEGLHELCPRHQYPSRVDGRAYQWP